MKKRLLHCLLSVALAATAPTAWASWYGGTIANVQVGSDGWILLFINGPSSTCGGNEVIYTRQLSGNDDAKAILSMLLGWQAQGTPVRVSLSSCDGSEGVFAAVVNDPSCSAGCSIP